MTSVAKAYRIESCPECGALLELRNNPQNAKFHAMVTSLSHQKQWAGQWLEVEQWKRLLIAAYERAHKRPAQMFPALDGQGFDVVYKRSSRMTKAEMADLITWVEWWAAENEVNV